MSSSNYKGFSHDPGGSSSHKRPRSSGDIDVYHQDRIFGADQSRKSFFFLCSLCKNLDLSFTWLLFFPLGYPIETSYVRSIASIRPRQLTFQGNIKLKCIICLSNACSVLMYCLYLLLLRLWLSFNNQCQCE
jgi:hypothetical protein